ncbi:MAG: SAM-dependent methyltransferase, partial [Flavobacterium sp.]
IISEAGCPGVADPGAVAVGFAHQLGYKVRPLVGPSSILLALMASGFNGQSFTFHGYLPIEKASKIKAIKNLELTAKNKNQTQIFMETPFRNNQLLDDTLQNLHPEVLLCIAANITAEDEFIKTLPVREWKKQKPDLHKKPTIFLLL